MQAIIGFIISSLLFKVVLVICLIALIFGVFGGLFACVLGRVHLVIMSIMSYIYLFLPITYRILILCLGVALLLFAVKFVTSKMGLSIRD